jgi:hypothetical protein
MPALFKIYQVNMVHAKRKATGVSGGSVPQVIEGLTAQAAKSGGQLRAAAFNTSRVCKATRRAAWAKSAPDEAYKMAREELTMVVPGTSP